MKKSPKRKRRFTPILIIALILIFCIITAICYGKLSSDKNSKKNQEPETQTENTSYEQNAGNNQNSDYDYSLSNSDSPYLIKVNRAANCVTVYAKDEEGHYTTPIKAIICSTGKKEGDTPLGTFQTSEKYDWRKMVDGTYSQYAYRIEGEIMFHSVPCYKEKKDELEYEEYNKLGTAASLGCIRMTVRDTKWIYDNCPAGTTVVIYDDADNPGPLGKPEAIKIPEDSAYSGWDPTDPDPENPWLSCYPVISNAVDLTVKTGSSMNLLKHIKAIDTCGNDISKKVGITGNYDLSKPGIYTVTYTVTDVLGKSTSVSAYITVTDLDIETTSIETVTPARETTKYNSDDDDDDDDDDEYRYINPATEPATEQPVWTEPATTAETQPATEQPVVTEPPTTEEIVTTTENITTEEQQTTAERETKKPSSERESEKKKENNEGE